jgi:hypothetical protein
MRILHSPAKRFQMASHGSQAFLHPPNSSHFFKTRQEWTTGSQISGIGLFKCILNATLPYKGQFVAFEAVVH